MTYGLYSGDRSLVVKREALDKLQPSPPKHEQGCVSTTLDTLFLTT